MPTPGEIQTCINNLTSSSDITEMVVLAAETSNATTNRSIVVSDTSNLPDIATNNITVGTVIFVQSLCIPVVAGVGCWMTLDNPGRIVRQDCAAGDIWSWGPNNNGNLGDNSATVDKSSPVSIIGCFTDWCNIAAGSDFSIALRTNGTIWSWGCNNTGQLGDNTLINKSSPVSVGGYTDWSKITSDLCDHALAIRQNGTLWAWGVGTSGRLGDNSAVTKSSPVSVVGGFTDWCQASAGASSSGAIRTDGTAWTWGLGSCGVLGDSTIAAKSSPVSVVGGFTDWCQISVGDRTASGVRTNGTAWSWGLGTSGRLGDNTVTDKSSPVSVVGGFTDWYQINVGHFFTLGLRQNGTVWGWGCNQCGVLGDNTTANKSSPVSVVGGFTDWCQINAGCVHSVGVRLNGTAWAWGSGAIGRLGDNTALPKSSPVSVVGGFTDWCRLAAGSFTLGIRKY